ncbi:MAG: SH3 domain-containing protein [Rickettsiales bacterium]
MRALLGLLILLAAPAIAEEKLQLPRFASLKSGQANMRVGPGENYPILWVYKKRGMPLEIVDEHQLWRKVRDMDGDEGWILKNLLTGRRTVMVSADKIVLHRKPDKTAPVSCNAEHGVVFAVDECRRDWCMIKHESGSGWAEKKYLWGVYPNELLQD